MDVTELVGKKLALDEVCEICIEGGLVTENFVKSTQYICVIERGGDHAFFIFSSKKHPCVSENDMILENVVAVDGDLKTVTETPAKDRPANLAPYLFVIQSKDVKYMYELAQSPQTSKFLAEVKKAKDLQSQNAGFGLPSSFSWLDKYQTQTQRASQNHNPFKTDVFDPLKYMQLDNNQTANRHSTGDFGFEDNFVTDNTLTVQKRSASKDSLDFLGNELTESLDEIQGKLGLAKGEEGLKPTSARETLVSHFLSERENEYTDVKPIRLFCGTWNVNGQTPGNLSEWLACDKEPPDVYALGFQELDLSNQAYIFADSAREQEWQNAVRDYLHPKAKYRKVKSIRLVGILLIVYVKESLVGSVRMIDCDQVPTGIMGIMGNKGGLGIRLEIHNTTLCFVNSHLAAHQDEFERRNQDSSDIETKMSFKQFVPPLVLYDHDMVFWMGDLNYRIDMEIGMVKELVSQGLYQKLLPHDQLCRQLYTNKVYKKYTEAEINFAPTYKYDTGTDDFDTSEKSRIPAWCDRILWKGRGIRQIIYRSHPSLKISDHKPVSSLFELGIKVSDSERYKRVYEDIMKKLDRLENDYLPTVALTEREFFYQDVKFIEPQSKILAIANIGQIPVTYEFINKPGEDSFCKSWLTVSPSKSVIVPGDSVEITMEVFVDKDNGSKLNSGEKLEDILVLHLHGGKDFFIPISGNYIPSSFGSSIEALVQMPGPIRKVTHEKLIDLEQPGSLDKVDVLAAGTRLFVCPKEIHRLLGHIYEYGRHQEDLFLQPGLNPEIQQIRDCLDTGSPEMLLIPAAIKHVIEEVADCKSLSDISFSCHFSLDDLKHCRNLVLHLAGSIHSVAEALLLFFEALPEPVIPYRFLRRALECSNNFLLCKKVLSQVPDCHRNVFKYTCALLRDLLQHSEHNNLEVKFLASLFGDLFLRSPSVPSEKKSAASRRQQVRSEEVKKAAFVYHFLTNEYDE